MSPVQVDSLFQTHTDFISNTCTLLLAPLVKKSISLAHNTTTTAIQMRHLHAIGPNPYVKETDSVSSAISKTEGTIGQYIPLENIGPVRTALKLYKESIAPFCSQSEPRTPN